jgi:WD40 repeat protein
LLCSQQYGGFTSDVTSADFSQTEQYVFAGSHAGTIVAWDVSAQKGKFENPPNFCLVATSFKEHIADVTSIFAQKVMDSKLVVSGSQDTNVKLWDMR